MHLFIIKWYLFQTKKKSVYTKFTNADKIKSSKITILTGSVPQPNFSRLSSKRSSFIKMIIINFRFFFIKLFLSFCLFWPANDQSLIIRLTLVQNCTIFGSLGTLDLQVDAMHINNMIYYMHLPVNVWMYLNNNWIEQWF